MHTQSQIHTLTYKHANKWKMHTETPIWACGIFTLQPDIPASVCQRGLQLEGHHGWQRMERKRCRGWREGRITNLAYHMVKQGRFTTDQVPRRQHGVVASECQVWEWDQTPALVCTLFLATSAEDGSVIGGWCGERGLSLSGLLHLPGFTD